MIRMWINRQPWLEDIFIGFLSACMIFLAGTGFIVGIYYFALLVSSGFVRLFGPAATNVGMVAGVMFMLTWLGATLSFMGERRWR